MRKLLWPAVLLCFPLSGLCASIPGAVAVDEAPLPCVESRIELSTSPRQLRSAADRCEARLRVVAVGRLNTLPLPRLPSIQTPASNLAGEASKQLESLDGLATIEALVTFGVGETYPPDEGLSSLASLIETTNGKGLPLVAVTLLSHVDENEGATDLARPIATGRLHVVNRALRGSGLPAVVGITAAIAKGGQGGLSAESDAKARAVRVVFVLDGRGTPQGSKP